MSKSFETPDHILTEEKIRQRMLDDYRLACISREASILGRKEVLTGKAKFGIFGDGKELAQIAMARQFKNGDWRAGYYRDQTFMMAIDELTVRQYFAALYAHTDVSLEPASGGRQMGGHYGTRFLNQNGSWKNVAELKNSSADISPTAGQMPRLLGLAQASKMYRLLPDLHAFTNFSNKGNEVAFGTIGDSSTSEGLFWETMNAAAVLGVPMCMSVWDNGWGISVPKKYQTVKESISEALSGFEKTTTTNGIKIFKVKGWNYPELLLTYEKAVQFSREYHIPTLVHVEELTQPQGHSTSGSHERYKDKALLAWYEEYDCLVQFKQFIVRDGAASERDLDAIREEAKQLVRQEQKQAWADFRADIDRDVATARTLISNLAGDYTANEQLQIIHADFSKTIDPIRKDIFSFAKRALRSVRGQQSASASVLSNWLVDLQNECEKRYSSHLYSESQWSTLNVNEIKPEIDASCESVDGRIILRDFWDMTMSERPEVLIFGEDVGKIGGVNQTCEGLQEKFGELRVADSGIREATILGQGIGMAMRGLRPVAEIQYLDYIFYALQIMRDDLASVQYRTKGGQKAPLIVSTRGHRLEGVWHAGSPMGSIIHSVRGMIVCVPRNMMQAAGMYNTLLQSDEPAIVVECLNGYRSKELKPKNLGQYTIPVGVPEVVKEGSDLTIVSYGSTFNLCQQTVQQLAEVGIDVELVDVRTLLPFDVNHICAESVAKTNRLLIVDEDVPGGASAFILDQIINKQGAFRSLDSDPVTLSAKAHLPAYGTDGDYFSKPSIEDIFDAAYNMMREVNPTQFPAIY
ncbi:MAG: alpha-ketoacid dehydrogenase subunit alpha/beta [Flavobacteriales bacterium]|jgi:pyruvate/2-oxoglutarate/acetoin dehydrogenase E1 component/TPP-dependent pyruvate/acetoin dehydrogenase alpha subunit